MSVKKLKSSGLLRLESKSVDKTDSNNNLVKKNTNVKIVRKKTDGQIEKTLTGSVLPPQVDKVVKLKVLNKAQEGGATVVMNAGITWDDNDPTNMAESTMKKQDEKKVYGVRKIVSKFSVKRGKTNQDGHRDLLEEKDQRGGEEENIEYPQGNFVYDDTGNGNGKNYYDNNDPAADDNPPDIGKTIVKKKKGTEKEPNRSKQCGNDALPVTQFEHPGNHNGRNDKSDKVEDDSENEILNSILSKNDESTLAEAPKEEVKKKKKKIIVRKKIPISEKLKNAEKANHFPGVQTIPAGRTPRGATAIITNNSNRGKFPQPNECCEQMVNEIKMNETKFVLLQETHKEKMNNMIQENKKEKDMLNTYIKNLNEEMHHINNKLCDETKEKDKLNENYQNLQNDKLELEEKVDMLKRQIEESNEMSTLLNEKIATLEEENKMLLDRDQQNELKVEQMQSEKIKMEKKIDEQNILIKKKDELINKYMSEIENYKNVLKNKGEMMILGSSTTIDKNMSDKNSQKEHVAKLIKEKKELIYAFKKQLDLIVILKKQISLLENNKIVNMTSGELKKVLHD
ncbi:conserved Plasmodium protein, unknown function [Plasmodium knowlesi strain H]|uniref:Uncharacterized protein n=3 Tax=Plasmodium knowlesi TaxID=5850 RepID=A0A5K1U489_PLAKH|nr:conserved Plasmodium protein, unknown function [Plasmodium knowlesi strain H]OTN68432.1 Uncharacterized protein PKNOH_S02298500 [Plasmodium knowlesi]CAA9986490.1 conserved Plasmodium protein, unknown function [Plasmodium knowlesi strain H]SBO24253.1 conserved Plasmodium protein, unknown function [Plasmodium knowlesi strain H]SBO29737.1 conserved Plasmodium protein, unknown function [Plasmodium knowlesi strain H]VVS75964.1 conserved Plasmodium protein, unknown function [Plasmodium knowlesi s|eukprot:XP_002261041.1 hypothetical protein, conserved in Plasmodium species [Plasmodium knowlesi strain H]